MVGTARRPFALLTLLRCVCALGCIGSRGSVRRGLGGKEEELMKVSLKWLSEYVDVPSDVKAFCDRLDLTGTGVEAIEKTGDAFDLSLIHI